MVQVLVLVTGALLCLQLANALPHVKREAVAVESSVEADNLQLQLEKNFVVVTLQNSKWTLVHGNVLIRNAVRDLNEIPVKSEVLQANITRMSHVATECSQINLEKNEDIEKVFDCATNILDVMIDYEAMPADSELRNTLKTALESNGYNQFDNQYKQKFMELMENFEIACNKLINDLSPAEREKQAKFIQWHDDFKAETDVEKKLEKFDAVFSFLS